MTSFLTKNLKQTAVYWGIPISDGYGGYTFADPVEIDCRWEDTNEVIRNSQGKEVVSKSKVFVGQDVDIGGYLFLGEIDDLISSVEIPSEEPAAMEIIAFDKVPDMRGAKFLRIAWL